MLDRLGSREPEETFRSGRRGVMLALQVLLSVLLLTTAVGKLLDNRGFAAVLETYQLPLPSGVLLPFGLAISLFELALGLALATGRALLPAARLNLVMQLAYLGLAIATNVRGLALRNCGCFGVFLARPMNWQTVLEDLSISLLSWGFVRLAQGAASARRPALRTTRAA